MFQETLEPLGLALFRLQKIRGLLEFYAARTPVSVFRNAYNHITYGFQSALVALLLLTETSFPVPTEIWCVLDC